MAVPDGWADVFPFTLLDVRVRLDVEKSRRHAAYGMLYMFQ